MKKRLFAFVLAFALCFSVGCGGTGSPVEPSNPINPTPGTDDPITPIVKEVTYETYGSFWMRQHDYLTMPVGAYNSLPPQLSDFTYNYLTSESTYAAYAEAGVNTMMGLYEYAGSKEVEQALDWCVDYNLAYLLPLAGADSFVSDSVPKSTLSRVKYHDAFAGIMQVDEPGRISFEKIKTSAEILDSIMPEDVTGTLWHVNLFPTYANKKQLYFKNYTSSSVLPEDGYTYEQYLSDYMEICQPKVLSYDYYPCSGDYGKLSNGYFGNMAVIRAAAAEANIPFWVFVQTCSYGGRSRIPNQAEILWQVNTALAYGAKGIQYFTGVVPTNGDGTGEQFDGAMFDRNGNRTDVYDYVKNANLQLAAADEVLMCCKSKGLILSGSMPWEGESGIPEEDCLNAYGALTAVSANHAIVGCFDYDGKAAFYVTNNSVTEGDTVTLTFDKSVNGYIVQKANKQEISGSSLSLTAEAGEGILVVIE